jgi:hypothetical protein
MRKGETSNSSRRRDYWWSIRHNHSRTSRRYALVVQKGSTSKETQGALRRAVLSDCSVSQKHRVHCIAYGERAGRSEEQAWWSVDVVAFLSCLLRVFLRRFRGSSRSIMGWWDGWIITLSFHQTLSFPAVLHLSEYPFLVVVRFGVCFGSSNESFTRLMAAVIPIRYLKIFKMDAISYPVRCFYSILHYA